jgi:hypothetical protein
LEHIGHLQLISAVLALPLSPSDFRRRFSMSMIDKKGAQPEALAKLAQVSRHDDGEPVKDGVLASHETAAIPTDPKLKQDAATKVLNEGVTHQDKGAKEAIDRLPDRTLVK